MRAGPDGPTSSTVAPRPDRTRSTTVPATSSADHRPRTGGRRGGRLGERRIGDRPAVGVRTRWIGRVEDDFAHEAEAPAVDGADQALIAPVVADRLTGGLDPARERGLGHEAIAPDLVEQLGLRHQADRGGGPGGPTRRRPGVRPAPRGRRATPACGRRRASRQRRSRPPLHPFMGSGSRAREPGRAGGRTAVRRSVPPPVRRHDASSTSTRVPLVSTSNTAERAIDCCTTASTSSAVAGLSIVNLTRMPW